MDSIACREECADVLGDGKSCGGIPANSYASVRVDGEEERVTRGCDRWYDRAMPRKAEDGEQG